MTLRKRVFYYGIGLAIGTLILMMIWDKKGLSVDYWPNARVLKDIRKKT